MDAPPPQLDRIGQLLRDDDGLRQRTIALRDESLVPQQSPIDEQRAGLARAFLFCRSYG